MFKTVARSIYGDLPELIRDPLGCFQERARTPSGISPLLIGRRQAYLISDPAFIRQVLLEKFENYNKETPTYQAIQLVLGRGMFTSHGPLWKKNRRLAQPAFHGHRVQRFGPILERISRRFADRWEEHGRRGEPVDASEDMMKITLEGVSEVLFGSDISESSGEINHVFPIVLKSLAFRVTRPLRWPDWMPIRRNLAFREALGSLNKVVDGLIQKRRQKLAEIEAMPADARDLLSTLMLAQDEETGERMSDTQLRDEVMTLMIAGHETTANALTWLWYLLDQHPEEQARLHQELETEVGDREPTVSDLPQLKRLKMVISESLRLYPPVWTFDRRAIAADTLGTTKIVPGDLIIISPYGIQRNPAFWSDPDTFRPERFEPGHEEQKNKFLFLPFGAGPRICLGQSFAMMESLLIMATLLNRFRVSLWDSAPVIPKPVVTLRPANPVLLRLELKKGSS